MDASDPSLNAGALARTGALVARAQGGDPAARNELAAHFRAPLQRFLHARLPQSARGLQETDDLVQEVLAKALAKLDRFEDRGLGSFWGFLRAIGLNEVRMAIRATQAAKRRAPSELGESHAHPADPTPGPLELNASRERFEAFERALARIPEGVRQAVELRLEMGLDFAAIAAECGLASPDAARMSVARAIERIAKEMSRDGLAP